MRLTIGLGLLVIAVSGVASIGPLFDWTRHMAPIDGMQPFSVAVIGLAGLVAVSAFSGARLTFASIRAAGERQADAIRRM